MSEVNFILLEKLCTHYKVDLAFFINLSDIGLIEIKTIEESNFVDQDKIYELEKIIRMYRELDVNIEGIDIIINLLQKINNLQEELVSVRNRLRLYEN
ncbi:MAG: chaperone modulator CbpM [Bacteroidota bacterium]|nr:chaperone modulator CbpM [Bacteroidota bacterium]